MTHLALGGRDYSSNRLYRLLYKKHKYVTSMKTNNCITLHKHIASSLISVKVETEKVFYGFPSDVLRLCINSGQEAFNLPTIKANNC